MHRDRSKRYAQVTDLIRDIEAYQGGFPTSAENARALRQLGLLIRRHRALAAVLLLSFIGASISAVRLARSERDARTQAARAEENAAAGGGGGGGPAAGTNTIDFSARDLSAARLRLEEVSRRRERALEPRHGAVCQQRIMPLIETQPIVCVVMRKTLGVLGKQPGHAGNV